MAIKSIEEKRARKLEIDLTGPLGNAFCLLGTAQTLCKQLGKDYGDISARMQSGDYENLLAVFEQEFGDYVDFYR